MNKSLIVLMAVCLLSVHAFVKRDAEAEKDNGADLSKQFEDFSKNIQGQLKDVFDPEKLKQGFNKFVDDAGKAFKSMEGKAEAPKS